MSFPSKFGLKSHLGTFLRASDHASAGVSLAPHLLDWEVFEAVSREIGFRSFDGSFLSAAPAAVGLATHCRTWAEIEVVWLAADRVALRSCHGNYFVSARPDPPVLRIAQHLKTWEHFTIVPGGGGEEKEVGLVREEVESRLEQTSIRVFDLGGSGLKTGIVDGERLLSQLQVVRLGGCPADESVAQWLRRKVPEIVSEIQDTRVRFGLPFSHLSLSLWTGQIGRKWQVCWVCQRPRADREAV